LIIDAMSSMVPTSDAFAAAEGTLARLQGYLEHFQSAGGDGPRSTPNLAATKRRIEEVTEAGRAKVPTEAEFFAMLDSANVDRAAVYTEKYETRLGVPTADNSVVAEFVSRRPDRLFGLGGVDPWEDDSAKEVDRAVSELGLKGIVISPFKQGLAPGDPRMARVYARCEALGVPVLLHTGVNWWFETTYDIGHPRYVDQVASAFPNLKIVALHCAWPWVLDMMIVAWRHPGVYVDISAHRPRHFTVEESGWTPLVYYGNRMLADKVLFASTWTLLNARIGDLIDEVKQLPLKDDVIEKWLGGNAQRVFSLD
jgi:predicted TIM-barrel fold metal-dependent hydrolase